jgi:hypothetical protein
MFSGFLRRMILALLLVTPMAEPARGADFQVQVHTLAAPPARPALEDLPLLTQITQEGITWMFSQPQRVGRFVNGDYYVVGPVTVTNIQPVPTPTNGRHGSLC